MKFYKIFIRPIYRKYIRPIYRKYVRLIYKKYIRIKYYRCIETYNYRYIILDNYTRDITTTITYISWLVDNMYQNIHNIAPFPYMQIPLLKIYSDIHNKLLYVVYYISYVFMAYYKYKGLFTVMKISTYSTYLIFYLNGKPMSGNL